MTKLLLLYSACAVALVSLGNAYGQYETPKGNYDDCVSVAGRSLCDFLFDKRSAQNVPQQDSQVRNPLPQNAITNASDPEHLIYNDNDHGFSIEVPKNWTYGYHNFQFNTVIGMEPPDNNNAYIDVRISPQGDYRSIKEMGDREFKNGDAYTLLGYYRNKTTELSGKPAIRAIYLVTTTNTIAQSIQGVEPQQYKGLFVGTLVPEKKSIYSIVYLANPADFDAYRPIFEKMVNSFKISGKGLVIQEDNSSSTGD